MSEARVRMVRTFSLIAAALLLVAAPASAQRRPAPIDLSFSHFLGPTSFFQTDLIEPWARELERRTRGQVKVRILSGADPEGEVTRQATQVESGAVDIALGLRGAEGDRFPLTSVVELPMTVTSGEQGSVALWRLLRDGALGTEYRRYKVLALFVHNPGIVHTISRRVVEPADMAGLRMRSPTPPLSMALTALGARPEVLQVNDVMPAVTAGRLDGVVTNWGNPLPNFYGQLRHHTTVPFYTAAFFIIMDAKRFAALPPDVRKAIDAMSGEALSRRVGRLWNRWDRAGIEQTLDGRHDTIRPTAASMARWRAALAPATDRYLSVLSKERAEARPTYERLKRYLAAVVTKEP